MTQQEKVLNYLRENGSITSLDMFNNFYICCPHAVIRDLRRALGMGAITDIWETKKRREYKSDGSEKDVIVKYKRYFLQKLTA